VYSQMDSIINEMCVEGPTSIYDYVSEKTVYGHSKRMMEIMTSISSREHGYRALFARCFAFVGPYLSLDGNYAIGNFMRDVLLDRNILVKGDGTPLRSYLYAADLVVWLVRILTNGRSGYPYNVGGDEVVSISQLANLVSKAGMHAKPVIISSVGASSAKPPAYLPSLERSKTSLNLRCTVSLEESIRRTLAWHRIRMQ
jgi:nucleoside-diphosphate-sugar epimerase